MVYGAQIANFKIAGGVTMYSGGVLRAPAWSTTESDVQFEMPAVQTAANLRVRTSTAQPGDGGITVTVRKNGTDQTLSVTVAAGAAAGTVSDLLNTVSYVAGDTFTISAHNASASVSATIVEVALTLT